jgi:large subunit ribosomal protein L21
MYAVFEDGSRQYRVSEGDLVKLDYREVEVGTRVEFKRVLLYQNDTDTRLGQPTVEGVRVVAEVVDHPSTKLYIQHFRRRKNYRRLKGHRQPFTEVEILWILLPGQEPPTEEEMESSEEEETEEEEEEDTDQSDEEEEEEEGDEAQEQGTPTKA